MADRPEAGDAMLASSSSSDTRSTTSPRAPIVRLDHTLAHYRICALRCSTTAEVAITAHNSCTTYKQSQLLPEPARCQLHCLVAHQSVLSFL